MAVYKRGYQRYQGPIAGRWTRFMVLPRFAWKRLFQQRLIILLMVVAFIWPLLVTRRTEMYNMELGLGFFQNAYTIDFGPISAASVVSFMPVLIVYFIFRKQIQRGVTLGAVKG